MDGANMPSEYGHTPTLINASLKSGSNGFHGDLFEFVRNSALDARNFFYMPPAGSALKNEPLQRNQYGFTLGGPIRRNKTFFFADMEETNIRQGQDINDVVPSAAQRIRRTSALQDHRPDYRRRSFPNNIIPASRISPQAAFLLPDIPLVQLSARLHVARHPDHQARHQHHQSRHAPRSPISRQRSALRPLLDQR